MQEKLVAIDSVNYTLNAHTERWHKCQMFNFLWSENSADFGFCR